MSWLQALTSEMKSLIVKSPACAWAPGAVLTLPLKKKRPRRGWLGLSLLSWAVTTKHHRLGGLNSRNVFFMVLEAGRPDIGCPGLDLQTTGVLTGHRVLTWPCLCAHAEGELDLPVLLMRPLTPSQGPRCHELIYPNCLLKAHLQASPHMRALTRESGETQTFILSQTPMPQDESRRKEWNKHDTQVKGALARALLATLPPRAGRRAGRVRSHRTDSKMSFSRDTCELAQTRVSL